MNAILLPLGIIAFLILVNGVFVAAEFAVAGATHTRMTQMAETGSIGAQRVLTILRSPRLINRYLSTAQVGITLASLGLGMYGEETFAEWIYAALVYAGL